MKSEQEQQAWFLDQLTKSEFFHQKLHEWKLLSVAEAIEEVKGETLKWDLSSLGISNTAWQRAIHRGIKPVIVFAHPDVLMNVPAATAYYRMVSMVSQKSMSRVGLSINRFEEGAKIPDENTALAIAKHLNQIISRLIEFDEQINSREFDLWRGMAAGSQAQGSWQNIKGVRIEMIIKGLIQRRLREKGWVLRETEDGTRMELVDGRTVVFADEPDLAIYKLGRIRAAMEVKGGIDKAGVLERLGASFKSLRRVREENPTATTILIIQDVSMTPTARDDLEINRDVVTYWFTIESVIVNEREREEVFDLLGI